MRPFAAVNSLLRRSAAVYRNPLKRLLRRSVRWCHVAVCGGSAKSLKTRLRWLCGGSAVVSPHTPHSGTVPLKAERSRFCDGKPTRLHIITSHPRMARSPRGRAGPRSNHSVQSVVPLDGGRSAGRAGRLPRDRPGVDFIAPLNTVQAFSRRKPLNN